VFFRRRAVPFQGDLGVDWRLVGIIHTGEPHWLTRLHRLARFRIQSLDIALFTDLYGRVHVHRNEILADHLASLIARGPIGTDRGADHSSARADDLTRNEANPQDIRIAVFLAEAQALREVRADYIAIEDRDLTTPLQQQRG